MANLVKSVISLIEKNLVDTLVTPESKIKELGFSSYTFIKFIVDVEDAFDIEFDDEFLDYGKFVCVRDVIEYVEACQR